MRKTVSLAVVAAMIVGILPGCATTDQNLGGHQGTVLGAGAGAVGGAIIGGLVGGKRGAVAGGLLGALAGGMVGNYYDQKEKDLAETRKAHPDPGKGKGTRLRIEKVQATPAVIAPGETVDIQVTYAILPPREDMTIPVREIREILHEGTKVGEAAVDIEREGGTWRSAVSISLPANARPGNYRVVASVNSPGGIKDVRETYFRVRQ